MSLAPFAALEARIATATASRLANAVVLLANGQAFGAELNRADEVAFEAVIAGGETLVFQACYGLTNGEDVTINGTAYRVASVPRWRDAHFSECEVVRA